MPNLSKLSFIICWVITFLVSSPSLVAQGDVTEHYDPEFLQSLEEQFNDDLGHEIDDDDYVFFTGQRVKYKPANVPSGRRSMHVVFALGRGGGVVGATNPVTHEVSIYYDNVANICPMPASLPLRSRLRMYSLILWHEAQHIPTDGGGESPPGFRGPGIGPATGVPGRGPILEPCEHLQLIIESYYEGCRRLADLIAELGPTFSEEECAELNALCLFQDTVLVLLNIGDLSSSVYHVGCGQPIGPWIPDPCDPCSSLITLCLPFVGLVTIGPINPVDITYSFNSQPILPQ